MAATRIIINTPLTAAQDLANVRMNGTGSWRNVFALMAWLRGFAKGTRRGNIRVNVGAVKASGTVTFSSIAAADTVTIGATVFTGSDTASGTAQFLTNVTPSGAADIVAATSLAAVINANAVTSLSVVATASGAVVTVTDIDPGLQGNFYPIAISAHGSVSGSGKLTSGTNGTTYNLTLGQLLA